MTEDKVHKTVQKRASVHEKTVQAIASGAVAPTPSKPRKKAERRTQPLDYHTKAHDMVMEAAQEIVGGVGQWEGRGYSKIHPVDNETVIVR